MKQAVYEQKKKIRRYISIPVAFLFHALSLAAMVLLLIKIEDFLFTRYGLYLTLHYKPLYELSSQDNLSIGIIISTAIIAVSLVAFLFLVFIKYKWTVLRIASLIMVNICSVLYIQSWRGIYNHIDPSRYRGSVAHFNEILTYDMLRDNIDHIFWYFFVIIAGSLIASILLFLNPGGWTIHESTGTTNPASSGEPPSPARARSIITRGNPDVTICPWFSEGLNMCTITDEHIAPEGNRNVRYCTSGNCINCPDYR